MARISTYPLDPDIQLDDKVIGTNSTDTVTKNYTLQQIVGLMDSLDEGTGVVFTYANTANTNDENTNGFFVSNAAINAVTELRINDTTRNGIAIRDLFTSMISGLGSINVDIRLENISNPNNYVLLNLTSITDNTDFFTLGVSNVGSFHSGAFTDTVSYIFRISVSESGAVNDILFDTTIGDTVATPEAVGGIPAGTTVAQLKTRTQNRIIEDLLLPTVLASVQTPNSVTLTGITASNMEIGSSFAPSLTTTYNAGQIRNGNGTTAGVLTGDLTSVSIVNIASVNVYTQNSPAGNTDTTTLTAAPIVAGNNRWTVTANYAAGTTAYTDNKGNAGTNLSAQQQAGSVNSSSSTVSGRYNRWHHVGAQNSSPTNSAGVRALTTNSFLSTTNTGTFTVAIGAGSANAEFSFYIPSGRTIQVIDLGNLNLNITSDFNQTNLTINDGGGNAVNYIKYTRFAGLAGFTNPTTFQITIT